MKTAAEAWKENLEKKVAELRQTLLKFMTSKDDAAANDVAGKLDGLRHMFSDGQVPQTVTNLARDLHNFRNNKSHVPFFQPLINRFNELPAVAEFAESEPLSFDQIFESYKDDKELDGLVNELVEMLKRILAEADDTLSAQIARELQIILDQLKKRDRRTLYELQSWIDLASRTLLLYIGTQTGAIGLPLVYDAAKITLRIKTRLFQHYGDAQAKLIEEYKLKYVDQAVKKIPEMPFGGDPDEYLRKFLPPAAEQPKPAG